MASPNPPQPDFPAEVRAEMARRGWSLRDLAAQVGMSPSTLQRRLRGDTGLTVTELAEICEAFGIPLSTFVERAEGVAA